MIKYALIFFSITASAFGADVPASSLPKDVPNTNTYFVGVNGSGQARLFPATNTAIGFNPNAITNNQTTATTLSNNITLSPPGLNPLTLNNNTGVGMYNFNDQLVTMGNGGLFNSKNNGVSFGSYDASGNMAWGGLGQNNAFFSAPYLVGGTQMMTNKPAAYDFMAHVASVPRLEFTSFIDQGCTPNGQWITNCITLIKANNWDKYGWTNVDYDCGVMTNRTGGHFIANATAFPGGTTAVVVYAHSQGFNIGGYLAHAWNGCAGETATPDQYIWSDVGDIASAGFDFLKVDNCGSGTGPDGLSYASFNEQYGERHCQLFTAANEYSSRLYGRQPMRMLTTELFNVFNPHLRTSSYLGFNEQQNGNPNFPVQGWSNQLANFIYDAPIHWSIKPGHFLQEGDTYSTVAIDAKGSMTICALTPSGAYMHRGTNVLIDATVAQYYTNPVVNFGLIMHPLCAPGFQVDTNNKTTVVARPLGPPNGIRTSANLYNGGYITYGGSYSNAIGVFNMDTGAGHAITVSFGTCGIASNTPVLVYDVWNKSIIGMATNFYTTTSIAANDMALYTFSEVPFSTTNGSITPMSEAFIGQTGDADGAYTLHIQARSGGNGLRISQDTAPFGGLVSIGMQAFGVTSDEIYDEHRSAQFADSANTGGEYQLWFNNRNIRAASFGQVSSIFPGIVYATNGVYSQIVTKTSSYGAGASDEVILVNGATLTITLPTAIGIAGKSYTIKLIASATTATVATTSSQNIDAATTYSLSAQYKYVRVISNGTQWYIVANN